MALTWAKKRQLVYGTLVSLFILIVGGTYVYFKFFNEAPTCFDHRQNGVEQGVDCGGYCSIACNNQVVAEPVLLWSRPFVVARGLTNLVAYLQNTNVNYVGREVEYLFNVYDKDNVLIGQRFGRVTIPPAKNFAIFEQGFNSGERVPVKAFFQFNDPIVWELYRSAKPELAVNNSRISNQSSVPRVDAVLENKTINRYQNIEVVALVYDTAGTAAAASKTIIDDLRGGSSANLVFTWPGAFNFEVSKVEIIPKLPVK
jgi:hypothetical protein